MITIIIGLPGSGKSCYAAYLAHKWEKKDIRVYSNFDIHNCLVYDVEDLGRYMVCDGNVLLDEAGIDVSNRDFLDRKNKSTDKNARRFWKKYRHNGIDQVYIFSQAFDFDKQLRNLADRMYIIERGLLPHFSRLRIVKPYWDVDIDGQPCVKWKLIPFLFIPFFRLPYYKYYNSFERDELPLKRFPISKANILEPADRKRQRLFRCGEILSEMIRSYMMWQLSEVLPYRDILSPLV